MTFTRRRRERGGGQIQTHGGSYTGTAPKVFGGVTPTCCIRGFRRYTAKLARSDSERKIQAYSQNRSVSHAKRGQPRHCRDCLVLCRWDVMETSALGTWRAESCRSRGHAAQHPPRKHDRAPAYNGTRRDTAENEMAHRARCPPPPVC